MPLMLLLGTVYSAAAAGSGHAGIKAVKQPHHTLQLDAGGGLERRHTGSGRARALSGGARREGASFSNRTVGAAGSVLCGGSVNLYG